MSKNLQNILWHCTVVISISHSIHSNYSIENTFERHSCIPNALLSFQICKVWTEKISVCFTPFNWNDFGDTNSAGSYERSGEKSSPLAKIISLDPKGWQTATFNKDLLSLPLLFSSCVHVRASNRHGNAIFTSPRDVTDKPVFNNWRQV